MKAAKTSAEWRRADRMGSRPGDESPGTGAEIAERSVAEMAVKRFASMESLGLKSRA